MFCFFLSATWTVHSLVFSNLNSHSSIHWLLHHFIIFLVYKISADLGLEKWSHVWGWPIKTASCLVANVLSAVTLKQHQTVCKSSRSVQKLGQWPPLLSFNTHFLEWLPPLFVKLCSWLLTCEAAQTDSRQAHVDTTASHSVWSKSVVC